MCPLSPAHLSMDRYVSDFLQRCRGVNAFLSAVVKDGRIELVLNHRALISFANLGVALPRARLVSALSPTTVRINY
jgi:hypothetical protein